MTTRTLSLRLPFPPSANAYWEVVPNPPRIVVTKEARIYKRALALTHGCLTPFDGPVRVARFHVFAPNMRCDLDNCFKVTFDALEGLAWLNDNQVKRMDSVEWWLDAKAPRLELEVEPYERADLTPQRALPLTAEQAKQLRAEGEELRKEIERRVLPMKAAPRKPTPAYVPARKDEK